MTQSPKPPISTAAAWFTLWALVATLLFAFMDRQVIALVAAPMARSLSLSDSQLGIVQGLGFTIFTLVATYPIAWLADRVDRRLVLGLCVLMWAAGTAACGLAQSFEQLFLAVVFIAAGEAALGPLVGAVIPDLFQGPQRVTANLVFYVAALLGAALGFLLGGLAIAGLTAGHDDLPQALQSLEAWRLAFLIVAAPAPLFLVLIAFMRLAGLKAPMQASSETPEPVEAKVGMAAYLRAHGRILVLIVGGVTMFAIAFGGVYAWVPVAMDRLFHVTPARNGVYLGIGIAVGVIVGVVAASLLMRVAQPRLGRRAALRIMWIAMAVAVPGAALWPFVTAAWQAYVLVGAQGVLGLLIGSLGPHVLQDIAPGGLRARVMAINGMVSISVTGLGVWATGALSDLLGGPRSLLWALVLVSLPCWLLGAILLRAAERPFQRMPEWSANA